MFNTRCLCGEPATKCDACAAEGNKQRDAEIESLRSEVAELQARIEQLTNNVAGEYDAKVKMGAELGDARRKLAKKPAVIHGPPPESFLVRTIMRTYDGLIEWRDEREYGLTRIRVKLGGYGCEPVTFEQGISSQEMHHHRDPEEFVMYTLGHMLEKCEYSLGRVR